MHVCCRAMSVWDTSLQITTGCSVVGAWLGAFPIPLDWDRPWQVSNEGAHIHTMHSNTLFSSQLAGPFKHCFHSLSTLLHTLSWLLHHVDIKMTAHLLLLVIP